MSTGNVGWRQWLNIPAVIRTVEVLLNPSLGMPSYAAVQGVAQIDFAALKKAGVKGIVFDKDNCLTAPYADVLHPSLLANWASCKSEFGTDRILIYSNWAGSADDEDGAAAKRLEEKLGVQVLRHDSRKPDGGDLIRGHFNNLPGENMAMVGDRLLTDVVCGNLNGMLTIHTAPLVSTGEKIPTVLGRKFETFLLAMWKRNGVLPNSHAAMEGPDPILRSPTDDVKPPP